MDSSTHASLTFPTHEQELIKFTRIINHLTEYFKMTDEIHEKTCELTLIHDKAQTTEITLLLEYEEALCKLIVKGIIMYTTINAKNCRRACRQACNKATDIDAIKDFLHQKRRLI